MRLRLTLALIGLLTNSSPVSSRTAIVRASAQLPGTYSNLRYNEESGDLGMEVKIVPIVSERYQAVVLESIGEPQPMHVVDVHVTGASFRSKLLKMMGLAGHFEERCRRSRLRVRSTDEGQRF